MFEKEAEEWEKEITDNADVEIHFGKPVKVMPTRKQSFQKGAEFGYRKANEWQYGTPDTGKDLLCQTAPDEFEVGYYHPEDERFYTLDGKAIDVIAWKEIVPPEVKNA